MPQIGYQKKHQNSLKKWLTLLETWDTEVDPLPYEENSQIFAPLPIHQMLTPAEHKGLFYNYHQLHCEILIFFEQCLMYSAFRARPHLESEAKLDLAHFSEEEFYHTKAFRKYLSGENNFLYPQTKFLLSAQYRLRRYYSWVLKKEPWSILIPGAKSEIYFLQYFNLTLKENKSFYRKLNQLHSADEVHHIPFDFDLINNMLEKRSFWGHCKFWAWTTVLIFLNQFLVLTSFWRLVKKTLPERSSAYQTIFFLRLCYHQIHGLPYRQTRRILKEFYQKEKRKTFWFLRYSSW